MRVLVAVFIGIFVFSTSPAAHAWNKPTHMVSAAIAYADLKARNPAVLAEAIEVLKKHPHYKSKWAPILKQVSADDRDLYLFMLAARWPDDIRGKYPEYDTYEWHFVNIPFRPGEAPGTIPEGKSIITAFPENHSIAKSTSANDKDRAVALCWIFHLTGDIHQPLHTVKLVTDLFPEPKGDRGGTWFYIRVTPNGGTRSLHKLWDGLIISSDKFQSVRNRATKLRNRAGLKREDFAQQLKVKPFNDWALEAYSVAEEHAYRKGSLKGSNNEDDGVVLPADYRKKAKAVAEKQIVLSGYRLSDAMVEVFGQ